jgi:CDP-diacylglycerol--serine O-phosphatidyltransferase
MNFKSHIPNFITVLNLISGSFAVILLFRGCLTEAALFIGLAAVLDFLDGFVAKLLNAKSIIGKELDSLADVVSFGLVPALFLFMLMENSVRDNASNLSNAIPYISLAIAGFSALRLAKFNIDTRQTVSFLGLPTPANAILIISFVIVASYSKDSAIGMLFSNTILQVIVVFISCYLLVSEIPMFSLKFKTFGLKGNEIRYAFLLISAALIIGLGWVGIFFTIIVYIVMSLIFNH